MKTRSDFRAGFVALLGEPNAGKSTLMNSLLGEKVSIVSEKPQTTRSRIHGILSEKNAQIIFVDAPGTLSSSSGINTYLQEEVTDVLRKADVVLVVLSAETADESAERLLNQARDSGKPFTIIVTKGDLLKGERAPKCMQALIGFKEPFVVISVLKNESEAKSEILNRLVPMLPVAPGPLYDQELLTTESMRKLAAEFIREACFHNTRQEVPYGLAVRVNKFEEPEAPGGITKIYADIVVERAAHKGIVIGAKAANLKKIGIEARREIERLMGEKIYLELHVDVREGWTKNKRMLKELGYVVVKE